MTGPVAHGRYMKNGALKLTDAVIEAGKSTKGGFTRKQLAAWGVPWPPPAGWRTALRTGQPIPKPQRTKKQRLASKKQRAFWKSRREEQERTAEMGAEMDAQWRRAMERDRCQP